MGEKQLTEGLGSRNLIIFVVTATDVYNRDLLMLTELLTPRDFTRLTQRLAFQASVTAWTNNAQITNAAVS